LVQAAKKRGDKRHGGAAPGGGDVPAATKGPPGSTVPGRSAGKRTGGELGGLEVASTLGRRKAPVRRSRGARLDSELKRSRNENRRLAQELQALNDSLARAEAELSEMRPPEQLLAESQQTAAVTIQAQARGVAGRRQAELVRKKEAEVEALKAEGVRRAEELASRQRELEAKEQQHAYYKLHQKREQDRKRAAVLERKRRLLDESEVLPEDEENAVTLEDVSASAIQRIARGRAARHYAKALRDSYAHAATIIESAARGMFHRKIVRLMRRKLAAVMAIQCLMRGAIGRMHASRKRELHVQWHAAALIARCYRGLAGRIRHARKRMLSEAAQGAAKVVNVKHLYPNDLKELSEAIAKPLVDATVPFPPAAVLGLLRILVCILQSEKYGDTVTAFNTIGVKQARPLKPLVLGWEDGMRVLRRAHKLLRQMRALAAGPASRRPRLLYLPREALELMAAYEEDPVMSVASMRQIGNGAKAASHLLAFAKDLITVHELQRHFLDEIGDVLPGWLHRQRVRQRSRRRLVVELATLKRAVSVADDCVQNTKAAGDAWGLPQQVLDELSQQKREKEAELAGVDDSEGLTRAKEEAEERASYEHDREQVEFATRDVSVKKQEYAEKKARAERGGKAEELLLPRLLSEIQAATVTLREMETRLALAGVRRSKNEQKRREWFEHPHEVRFKAAMLGEAVALLRVATKERKAFVAKMGGEVYLKTLKGRFAGELTYHDKRVESGGLRSAECAQALEVVNKQFERELERLFEEERQREAKPGDWNTPSLEEKEEDRLEDEQQAREEAERAR
jgi:hypothetical protein